jgi:hypothetical protein
MKVMIHQRCLNGCCANTYQCHFSTVLTQAAETLMNFTLKRHRITSAETDSAMGLPLLQSSFNSRQSAEYAEPTSLLHSQAAGTAEGMVVDTEGDPGDQGKASDNDYAPTNAGLLQKKAALVSFKPPIGMRARSGSTQGSYPCRQSRSQANEVPTGSLQPRW